MGARLAATIGRSRIAGLAITVMLAAVVVGPAAGAGAPGTASRTALAPAAGAPATVLVSSGTTHVAASATVVVVDKVDVSTFAAVRILAEATAHVDYEILADSLHVAQFNGQVRLSEVYEVPGRNMTFKVTEADGLPAGQDVSWAIYGLPHAASGGGDGAVILGGANVASTATSISNAANADDVLVGESQGAGTGVRGISTLGKGVRGEATTGTGVYAKATTGTALQVVGRMKYDRAGTVKIRRGQTSYKKVLAGITSSSQVFAVLRTYRSGTYVAAVVCGTGYFTIRLNKAIVADTNVSYFVVN